MRLLLANENDEHFATELDVNLDLALFNFDNFNVIIPDSWNSNG